jgi:hypothetical protein
MSDLDCREFVEEVTSFLEGDLGPADEQRFIDHLALCEGCDRYLDQIRQTVHKLRALPAEALSPENRESLLNTFRSQ